MKTLYHYCSTTSFHSIVQSRAIWLSSLSLANDTMEGKLVYATLRRLAERDGLDAAVIEQLLNNIDGLEKLFDGLGFCLSHEGDLLSQWRGYASDASGVAIGFSNNYLKCLSKQSYELKDVASFTLEKVFYDPSEHDNHVRAIYDRMKKAIEDGAFDHKGPQTLMEYVRPLGELKNEVSEHQEAFGEFFISAFTLFPALFKLKSPAFIEEREWRLLSHHTKSNEPKCSYRVVHDRIVPYYECKLSELSQNPIQEVILGPKHNTPIHVVEQFLDENGFNNVRVYRSKASYR